MITRAGQTIDVASIAQAISRTTGTAFRVDQQRSVGGGCINQAMRLEGDGQVYFIKLNDADLIPMFQAEAAGLEAISGTGCLRTPRVITSGVSGERSWLALEYIALRTPGSTTSSQLGEDLAAMHRASAPSFGWHRDNNIGATEQVNSWSDNWVDFLGRHRLGCQLRLAAARGAPAALRQKGVRLLEQLPRFFDNYQPRPSLLHGDLWSGNWAADETGSAVIFDPAVYFGDREADIAMTELFGGFDPRFYQAYRSAWPLDGGYRTRKNLYNLYHVINHFNLFGGSYGQQAQDMIDRLLAELTA